MDLEEMRHRVAAARVARLASIDSAGRPHLVPVTFALTGEEIVTAVDHKHKRTARLQRLENVRANPLVTLLVDHYEDDWDRLWWVRIRGTARVVEDGPALEAAQEALRAKYEQYQRRSPEGSAIVVTAEDWLGWSAGDQKGVG